MDGIANSEDEKYCYTGTAECGCCVAVVADDPEYKKKTAKAIAEFVRDGLTVNRVDLDEFRSKPFGHQCDRARRKQEKQQSLFGGTR